jgi:hypothetical protein
VITRSRFIAFNKGAKNLEIVKAGVESKSRKSQADNSNDSTSFVLGGHCVLATRGGNAVVTNCTASSTPVPSGVGIDILNGTNTRVPAIGASQTSMLRWAARYLIAARSGM